MAGPMLLQPVSPALSSSSPSRASSDTMTLPRELVQTTLEKSLRAISKSKDDFRAYEAMNNRRYAALEARLAVMEARVAASSSADQQQQTEQRQEARAQFSSMVPTMMNGIARKTKEANSVPPGADPMGSNGARSAAQASTLSNGSDTLGESSERLRVASSSFDTAALHSIPAAGQSRSSTDAPLSPIAVSKGDRSRLDDYPTSLSDTVNARNLATASGLFGERDNLGSSPRSSTILKGHNVDPFASRGPSDAQRSGKSASDREKTPASDSNATSKNHAGFDFFSDSQDEGTKVLQPVVANLSSGKAKSPSEESAFSGMSSPVLEEVRKREESLKLREASLNEKLTALKVREDVVKSEALRLHGLEKRLAELDENLKAREKTCQDHEHELEKRIAECQRREEKLHKLESTAFLRSQGARPNEIDAATFRRMEDSKAMKKEWTARMEALDQAEAEWCEKTGEPYVPRYKVAI